MEYDDFLRQACSAYDLQWRKYRRRSARRRVAEHIRELDLRSLSEYLDLLAADPAEAAALPDLLRVTVTRFFRERERWGTLADRILPELLGLQESRRLQAWSAGCCGGEEPYTLALVWQERLQPRYPNVALEIVATDIDLPSLERARQAVYGRASLREVPPGVLERWFVSDGNALRLRPEAARMVEFRERNLRTDPPPREMDLVLCRYLVFTYYKGERRFEAARKLREALRPGGVLMIGRKEGLGPEELSLFSPWSRAPGFYAAR